MFSYSLQSSDGALESVKADHLAEQLKSKLPALRLMGLLHDLTHAAFGHTLEDEVNVFDEKHDHPRRQARFFNALIGQLLYLWSTEAQLHPFDAGTFEDLSDLNVSVDYKRELAWAEELREYLGDDDRKKLAKCLRDLELAFRLLLHLEFIHSPEHPPLSIPPLLISAIADALEDTIPPHDFVVHVTCLWWTWLAIRFALICWTMHAETLTTQGCAFNSTTDSSVISAWSQ